MPDPTCATQKKNTLITASGTLAEPFGVSLDLFKRVHALLFNSFHVGARVLVNGAAAHWLLQHLLFIALLVPDE